MRPPKYPLPRIADLVLALGSLAVVAYVPFAAVGILTASPANPYSLERHLIFTAAAWTMGLVTVVLVARDPRIDSGRRVLWVVASLGLGAFTCLAWLWRYEQGRRRSDA